MYEVVGRADVVAKIYHEPPDALREKKLRVMVQRATPVLTSVCAWPTDLVCMPGSGVVGLLMPKVSGGLALHECFTPGDRKQQAPDWTWRHLLHVGRNIADVFHVVHGHDAVIGDVNQNGIRVFKNDGIVRLIDCDSFQIQAGSEVLRCNVGTGHYTPPELMGHKFDAAVRTPAHDAFGLAVLLFQLLFGGRHPFAGEPTAAEDIPIEKAIHNGLYPYVSPDKRTRLQPPKFMQGPLEPRQLTPSLAELFERAFLTLDRRPAPADWVKAIDSLRRNLRRCDDFESHVFCRELPACPWCILLDRRADYFPLRDPALYRPENDFQALCTELEQTIELVFQALLALVLPKVRSVTGLVGKPWPADADPRKLGPRPVVLPKPVPTGLEPPPLKPEFVQPALPPKPALLPEPPSESEDEKASRSSPPKPTLPPLPRWPRDVKMSDRQRRRLVLAVTLLSPVGLMSLALFAATAALTPFAVLAVMAGLAPDGLDLPFWKLAVPICAFSTVWNLSIFAAVHVLPKKYRQVTQAALSSDVKSQPRGSVAPPQARSDSTGAETSDQPLEESHLPKGLFSEDSLAVRLFAPALRDQFRQSVARTLRQRERLREQYRHELNKWRAACDAERKRRTDASAAAMKLRAEVQQENARRLMEWESSCRAVLDEAQRKYAEELARFAQQQRDVTERNARRFASIENNWHAQVQAADNYDKLMNAVRARSEAERQRRVDALNSAEQALRNAEQRIKQGQGPLFGKCNQIRAALDGLRQQFADVLRRLDAQMVSYGSQPIDVQRQEYLKTEPIHSGIDRLLTEYWVVVLLSYGVSTAADISEANLDQISGFRSGKKRQALLAWRARLEQQFRPQTTVKLDAVQIQKLNREFRPQFSSLLQAVRQLKAEAAGLETEVEGLKADYKNLDSLIAQVEQARVDLAMEPK